MIRRLLLLLTLLVLLGAGCGGDDGGGGSDDAAADSASDENQDEDEDEDGAFSECEDEAGDVVEGTGEVVQDLDNPAVDLVAVTLADDDGDLVITYEVNGLFPHSEAEVDSDRELTWGTNLTAAAGPINLITSFFGGEYQTEVIGSISEEVGTDTEADESTLTVAVARGDIGLDELNGSWEAYTEYYPGSDEGDRYEDTCPAEGDDPIAFGEGGTDDPDPDPDDDTGLGEPEDPLTIPEFGESEIFDLLADGCFTGSLADCDELYRSTPIGSGYETYGSTCGGRTDERLDGGCEQRAADQTVDLSGPATAPQDALGDDLGTDAQLDTYAFACEAGNLEACDRLFAEAPIGSAHEAYGATCGGRSELELNGNCERAAAD